MAQIKENRDSLNFATLEDEFVENAKSPFSRILLGEKLSIPELGNIPPNFKTTLSDFLILDASRAQRVAGTRVQ